MIADIHKSKCEFCGKFVKNINMIHISQEMKTTPYCSKCYNEYIAEEMGLDFQHVDFDPISLQDIDGVPHTFEFRSHIFGENVSIEAFEFQNGQPKGYEFGVAGVAEEDMFQLFQKLFEKIRRALGRKHIETGTLSRYQITEDDIIRGRIAWDDDEDGRVPGLVIDGKELSWDELGTTLMTYEGFNFKLEIFDRFEER